MLNTLPTVTPDSGTHPSPPFHRARPGIHSQAFWWQMCRSWLLPRLQDDNKSSPSHETELELAQTPCLQKVSDHPGNTSGGSTFPLSSLPPTLKRHQPLLPYRSQLAKLLVPSDLHTSPCLSVPVAVHEALPCSLTSGTHPISANDSVIYRKAC